MRNCHNDCNSCQICHRTTIEQRVVMASLMRKMGKLTIAHDFIPRKSAEIELNHEGLARLVKVLSISQPLPSRHHPPCLHLKWMKVIRRHLGVNFETIDGLCHQNANGVAKRNYHLHLLKQQTKNVGMRLGEGELPNGEKVEKEEEVSLKVETVVKQENEESRREECELVIPIVTTIYQPALQLAAAPTQPDYQTAFMPSNIGFYFCCNFYPPTSQG